MAKAKRLRSKSKKRLVDEKENREAVGSLSPGRETYNDATQRSEKKKIKKKKITLNSTNSIA